MTRNIMSRRLLHGEDAGEGGVGEGMEGDSARRSLTRYAAASRPITVSGLPVSHPPGDRKRMPVWLGLNDYVIVPNTPLSQTSHKCVAPLCSMPSIIQILKTAFKRPGFWRSQDSPSGNHPPLSEDVPSSQHLGEVGPCPSHWGTG